MKPQKWTIGLAAVGLVTLPAGLRADEQQLSPVQTALTSTTISGYVNTSAHWDLGSGNAFPPAYSFNQDKQDGFNLNVVKLTIERPLDDAQWAAGYKVDLLFGPDANALATQSSLEGDDFGIKQAYVILRAPWQNGLDFKVGVFDTIIGYEYFDAGANPNYTRSWGYTIEPTTHTGVLMSYEFNDMISASAGVANTFGPAINSRAITPDDPAVAGDQYRDNESYKTYMGSVALTAPEDWGFLGGSSLAFGVINGFNNGINGNQTSLYAGTSMATPIAGLTIGTAHDWALAHNDDDNSIPDQHAYAHGLYASIQATEKLSFHGRFEYAKVSGDSVSPGIAEKLISLTGTAQYDLWKNVLSRLEIRWDHQAAGTGKAFGGGDDPDNDIPNKKDAVLIAANIIYQF
jgi:hypothetical protein